MAAPGQKIFSFNARGVGRRLRAARDFLNVFVDWQILLIQEGFYSHIANFEIDGHLVVMGERIWRRGRLLKPVCIIVHSSVRQGVQIDKFVQRGNCIGFNITLNNNVTLFVATASLDPYSVCSDFEDSLADVSFVISAAPPGSSRVLGIDAQTSASLESDLRDLALFGAHGLDPIGTHGNWKSPLFMRAVSDWGLSVSNTFAPGPFGDFTLFGHFAPRQIDFVLVEPAFMHGASSYPIDVTNGFLSDHRPVRFALPDGPTVSYTFLAPAHNRPRNWVWHKAGTELFNVDFRGAVGYPAGVPGVSVPRPCPRPHPERCYRAFCDGSFEGGVAGWGFTLFRSVKDVDVGRGDDQYVLFDNSGLVVTDIADSSYIGAESATNISGELTAFVELCWHLLDRVQSGFFDANNNHELIIYVDCILVKDAVNGKCAAHAHPLVITLARHLVHCLRAYLTLEIRWVRAHEGNTGNERADRLANEGRLKGGPSPGRVPLDHKVFQPLVFQERLRDFHILHPYAGPVKPRQEEVAPSPSELRQLEAQRELDFQHVFARQPPLKAARLEDRVQPSFVLCLPRRPHHLRDSNGSISSDHRVPPDFPREVLTVSSVTSAISRAAAPHGFSAGAPRPPALKPENALKRREQTYITLRDAAPTAIIRTKHSHNLSKVRRSIRIANNRLAMEFKAASTHKWTP